MSSARHPQDDLSLAFDRLNRVVKATQELNSTLDLSELARIILRIVREEVGIERGTVFVMSPEHDHLTSLVAQDVDQAIKVRLGFGIAGSVAESGEIVDIPDAYRDERFDHSFDAKLGFRTKDIYCMPVRNPDRTIVGVLQLLNRNRELSEDDKNFLRDISVHVGLAIENAARHLRILEEERVAQQLQLARETILVRSVRKYRLVLGVVRLRCPICLGGRVFKGLVGARKNCEDCGYAFWPAHRSFLASALPSAVVTLSLASLIWAALSYQIGPPPDSATLGVVGFLAAVVMLWFYRVWRIAWMGWDLYRTPPVEADFDVGKA